jgi:DNA-binding IclR family transcriptional regulator
VGSPKRTAASFSAADTEHPQFVTALARGLAILRCFERGEQYLGNQDIARRTGLPKPTVSRLTLTLSALGYLDYSAEREKYSLGIGVLGLGHAYLKTNSLIALARPLMQELADYTQAAVMLAGQVGSHMVLLDICQGDPTFNFKLEPGARVPHGSTALSRADLAARPPEVFEARLATLQQECPPPEWPALKAGILRARHDYEQYGFCFSLGDWNPDVFAVGVPIVSADRSRSFALNCSGRVSVMSRDKLLGDIGPRLVGLRNRLYEMTGGRF